MQPRTALLLFSCPLLACADITAEPAPSLLLASAYRSDVAIDGYWISEKYDGLRAFWNGSALLTRGGHRIHAPGWFIAGWPQTPLDGELWIGRGQFEAVSATVRDDVADECAWRQIRFMVFDLPVHTGPFKQRLEAMRVLVSGLSIPWVQATPQWRVSDETELMRQLDEIVSTGGEGLMLHLADSFYRAGRSDDLLKLKRHEDAEARVIGYTPGKGKYEHMLGALQVERADGLRFNLGTGFTDEMRRNPPAIGSWVTYAFHGLTARGMPRFARFLRTRPDMPPPEEPVP